LYQLTLDKGVKKITLISIKHDPNGGHINRHEDMAGAGYWDIDWCDVYEMNLLKWNAG
jgi:hypothetical protein